MLKQLSEIYKQLNSEKPRSVAVAAAEDEAVLQAVIPLQRSGMIRAILCGDSRKIQMMLQKQNESPDRYTILDCRRAEDSAQTAVKQVSSGRADILMKGFLQSNIFIRAVLDKQIGLHVTGMPLSAVAMVELKLNKEHRILFITDPGFIPLPDLVTKKALIQNTVDKLHLLGFEEPKVAALSIAEEVNPKIPSSTEARALQEMNERGEITGCRVCGPISMDLAISAEAAAHKQFRHPVAGRADVLLVPSLEVGNAVLKTMTQLLHVPVAGFVCGTTRPVVFTSRTDTAEAKRNTIALAALFAERAGQ